MDACPRRTPDRNRNADRAAHRRRGHRPHPPLRLRATPRSTPSAASRSRSRAASLTAVMGPSGSGKSTLMHILAGLDRPTSGTVEIDGTDITTLNDTQLTKLRRRHIGFVFQFFNLLPMLTAEENVAPAALARGRRSRTRRGSTSCSSAPASRIAARTGRPSSPAASSSASRSRARSSRGRPCSSPTSRPATSTRARAREILALAPRRGRHVRPDDRDGHARPAARPTIADRVLFLADGLIVKELGRSRRSRRSCASLSEVGSMTRVALEGPARPQAPLAADRDRDRPRRRDGQRHLRPHRHDRPRVRHDLRRARTTSTDAVVTGGRVVDWSQSGRGAPCRTTCSRACAAARASSARPARSLDSRATRTRRRSSTSRASRSTATTRRSASASNAADERFNPFELDEGAGRRDRTRS